MKNKKLLALALSLMLMLSVIAVPVCAAVSPTISPLWDNTAMVQISHQRIDGYACCNIEIKGLSGTTKIDNVNITLSRVSGSQLIEVATWDNLSDTGDTFDFYEEVANVPGGYTYRLSFTADVHRNGTVESLDQFSDRYYN